MTGLSEISRLEDVIVGARVCARELHFRVRRVFLVPLTHAHQSSDVVVRRQTVALMEKKMGKKKTHVDELLTLRNGFI